MFDEVVYPTAGYAYLAAGDYRLNAEHPPLLKLLTGATWLGAGLPDPAALPGWVEGNQWRFGRALLYGEGRDPRALLFRARVPVALLSAALALAVWATARRLGGTVAGLAALVLYAFDPLAIAHAGLATTDLGAAALTFGAAVALPGALREGGRGRIALAGALLGAALAAKFSALPLLLLLAALALLERAPGRAAAVAAIGAAVVAASYGPAGPAAYLRGLGMLATHGEVGHPAYAFGRYATQGWWWFFPAAWAVKTPLVILVAQVFGVLGTLQAAIARKDRALPAWLLGPPVVLLGLAMAQSINLGVRHLLPATPFLAVGGGLLAALLWPLRLSGVWMALMGAGLAAGTLAVHPHELAYGNALAGGPAGVGRLLADSNVDWGQALPDLAAEVGRQPLRRLYLSYFGTADPAAEGLRYRWIPGMGMAERRFEDGPDPGGREWLAVSLTNLRDVYTDRHDAHAWLRDRPMTAFPGHAIGLWDITGDAASHAAVGRTALRFGDAEAALGPLERAAELAPGDRAVRADLARAAAGSGDLARAAALCAELGEAEPCPDVRAALAGR